MDLGVILPSGVPGVDGRTILSWARRAEQSGVFGTVAAADRFTYDNYDALTTLAAAAAVTERVRLMPYVAVAPLKPAAVFAKEVATVSQLASGRLRVGVGVGARPSDYDTAGVSWDDRGALLDEALAALDALRHRPHDPQLLGPPARGVEVLVGGSSPAALRRIVTHGTGFLHGGLRPEVFGFQAQAVRGAWAQAGRPGAPRIVASTWYASSTRPDDTAQAWMDDYFVQGGPPVEVRDDISRGPDALRASIAAFRAGGADEVVLFPCVSDLAELDYLVDVVGDLATSREPAVAPAPQP